MARNKSFRVEESTFKELKYLYSKEDKASKPYFYMMIQEIFNYFDPLKIESMRNFIPSWKSPSKLYVNFSCPLDDDEFRSYQLAKAKYKITADDYIVNCICGYNGDTTFLGSININLPKDDLKRLEQIKSHNKWNTEETIHYLIEFEKNIG